MGGQELRRRTIDTVVINGPFVGPAMSIHTNQYCSLGFIYQHLAVHCTIAAAAAAAAAADADAGADNDETVPAVWHNAAAVSFPNIYRTLCGQCY